MPPLIRVESVVHLLCERCRHCLAAEANAVVYMRKWYQRTLKPPTAVPMEADIVCGSGGDSGGCFAGCLRFHPGKSCLLG